MAITVDGLTEVLRGLSLGERAWFWFCPEAEALGSPLIITPLSVDPRMAGLREQLADLDLPVGATQCAGIASVSEQGIIQLGSGMATAGMLAALADWVVRSSAAWPDLERLRDAAFFRIDGGRVVARYQDAALWLGLSAPAPSGSVSESAAVLDGLRDGQTAWLWMTAAGPGSAPFLLARPVSDDPTGEAFADAVAAARRRCPAPGPVLVGTAHKAPGGGFVLTTADKAPEAGEILDALLAAHGEALAMLQGARLFRISGSKRRELRPRPALARELAVLSDPDGAVFWLTDGGDGHPPALVLAGNRAALREAAKAVPTGAGARTARGSLHVSGKGFIEFRTRDAFDGFIGTLADWTARHLPTNPALARLSTARMTRRDADGTILDRQRSAAPEETGDRS